MVNPPGGLLDCRHFAVGECRSCTLLLTPYDAQLAAKQREVESRLGAASQPSWLPPVASPPAGFRTKAKMVVAGTVDEPTLGILDPGGAGVDLVDCGLHTPGIQAALPILRDFVTRAGLTPYDVPGRQGELKHVLVTESPDGDLMIRLVLRSTAAEARIRKHLSWLVEQLPVRVVTLNIQPEHKAVLEGDREIVLTEAHHLPMRVNDVTLLLGPRSFFQTNTGIAEALYAEARAWTRDLDITTVQDLYCGVGGFALHLALPGRRVTGVEISAEAIAAATTARDDAGIPAEDLTFTAADATAHLIDHMPDLVVVNPPRRGLGADLAARLEGSGAPYVLYSSCNPETLARDLANMPSYAPVRGRLFDMFPQTGHAEVLVLTQRRT